MIYGYCRISQPKQDIERQVRNILATYPNAEIFREAYTGTRIDGRAVFNKLLKRAVTGDTIIFDSVSRMSRNSEEGTKLYFELFNKGIELIFLKEAYINTENYRKSLQLHIAAVGNEIADIYINATNEVIKYIAKTQISIAFDQAEKEVKDLHQRTSEGMKTAKLNGKQIGRVKGKNYTTQKEIAAKEVIKKQSATFEGNLSDIEVIALLSGLKYKHIIGKNVIEKPLKLARNSYYKYKKELTESYNAESSINNE